MISWVIIPMLIASSASADKREYFEAAQQTAHWLQSCAHQTQAGQAWPADPRDSTTVSSELEEIFKVSKEKKYRDGALRCVKLLHEHAKKTGAGIEWNDVTDIIGGSAGTGLFLLYAAREMNDPASRNLAVQAGLRLIESGKSENGGLKWAISPEFPRLMPNFSHGTAGICYFLASLYAETRRKEFHAKRHSGKADAWVLEQREPMLRLRRRG